MNPTARAGFGRAADRYERGRPGFGADAVAWLVQRLGITAGATVVDLGAGTGKFTRALVGTGARLLAVEPVAGMRARLATAVPQAWILAATAEALPLRGASTDAVVAAQAFHWFDGPAALAEIARVLRPGGGLGLVWHHRDERCDWVAELTRIVDEHDEGSVPRGRDADPPAAIRANGRFGPVERGAFAFRHTATVDDLVDRFLSISFVATLPPDRRAQVERRVRAVLAAQAGDGGLVTLPYRTAVYASRRRGGTTAGTPPCDAEPESAQ